jgi:hypothetical protein
MTIGPRPGDGDLDVAIRDVLERAISRTPATPTWAVREIPVEREVPDRHRRPMVLLVAVAAGAVALAATVAAVVLVRDGGPDRVSDRPAVSDPAPDPSADPATTPSPVTVAPTTSIGPSPGSMVEPVPDLAFDWADDLSVVVQTGDRVAVLHGDGSSEWYEPGAIDGRRVWQIDGQWVGGRSAELTGIAEFDEIADVLGPDRVLLQGTTPGGGEPFFLLPTEAGVVTFDAEHLTLANDRLVGQQRTPMGWRPVAFALDGTADASFEADLGIGEQSSLCDCPRLFSVSPSGDTLAWIEGRDLVVLRNGLPERIALTDGSKVSDLDLTDTAAIIDRASTPATLVDLRDGSVVDLPVVGVATLALGAAPAGSTTSTAPSTVVDVPAVAALGVSMLVQDGQGVARLDPDGSMQRVVDIAGQDVRAFDDRRGGVVVQFADGSVLAWDGTGTEPRDPFAAVDFAGPMRIHDVAEVDGVPSYLMTVAISCDASPDPAVTCRVDGFVMAIDGGTSTPLGTLAASSDELELSMSDTGVIVGSRRSDGEVVPIERTISGDRLDDFDRRGLSSIMGCAMARCSHSFTVTSDGSTLVWLTEHGDVVFAAVGGDPALDTVVAAAFGDAAVSDARPSAVTVGRPDGTSAVLTRDRSGSWTAAELGLRILGLGTDG